MGQVVRRDRNRYAITGHDLDVEAAKTAADAGEEGVTLVALDAEMSAGERFHHFALNLDQIVSCHSMTSLPYRGGAVVTVCSPCRAMGFRRW